MQIAFYHLITSLLECRPDPTHDVAKFYAETKSALAHVTELAQYLGAYTSWVNCLRTYEYQEA